jgi:hypothetical protein
MDKNDYSAGKPAKNGDGTPKPPVPDIKPQTDQPEIKRPGEPEILPDIPEKPEVPATPEPAPPEIPPGTTREPEIPTKSPDTPQQPPSEPDKSVN